MWVEWVWGVKGTWADHLETDGDDDGDDRHHHHRQCHLRHDQSSAHLETKTLFLSWPLPELTQLMPNMVTATLASL